jgi:ubiquinone/menaquinone biosynthesis C-methylase UbiE
MKNDVANKILNETEEGYDFMADKFSETRKYFWRGLEFIGDYAKDGDTIFDFGCGNGRLLELFSGKKINYFGADASGNLIDIAKKRCYSSDIVFQKIDSSQTSLTFQDNFFNAVYSIAVFHHFPGKEYREKMAKELYRITKSEGFVIVAVWNLWQRKYLKNILKNWFRKIIGRSNLDWNDCYITFKDNKGNVFKRYHHAFSKKELCDLFSKAGFKEEKSINNKNIIFVGKKS